MGDPRFKRLEFKVGLFILIAIIMVFAVVIGLALKKNILTPKTSIRIYADSGEGLKKGMSVLYSGFQVARVEDILLQDDGRVLLKTRIPKDYIKWIRKDSEVKLTSQGVIGSAALTFYGGSGAPIEPQDTFELKRDKGIEELLSNAEVMVTTLQNILNNVDKITENLAKDDGNFNRIMTGLGDLGEDLSKKRGVGYLLRTDYFKDKTDALFVSVDDLTYETQKLLKSTEVVVNNVNNKIKASDKTFTLLNKTLKSADNLVLNIDDTLQLVKPSILSVNRITEDVSEVTDNLTLMKKEADFMLNTTNRILLNLESKWPFSSGKKREEGQLSLP